MLQAERGIEQTPDLVGAQHVGQGAGMVEADQPAGEIGAAERLDEEEAQGGDDGVHRRHAEAEFLLGDLEAAQVVTGRGIGRSPQEGSQPPDVADVVALRRPGEPAQGHVVDQALTQRAAGSGGNGKDGYGMAPLEGSRDRPPELGVPQSAQGVRVNPPTSKLPPIPRERVRSSTQPQDLSARPLAVGSARGRGVALPDVLGELCLDDGPVPVRGPEGFDLPRGAHALSLGCADTQMRGDHVYAFHRPVLDRSAVVHRKIPVLRPSTPFRWRLSCLMRTSLVALALALVVAAGETQAAGEVTLTVSQLLAEPKGHRGETVIVRGIRCVDPGPGGFICEAAVGRQQLRLDASGLGGGTTEAIAEKLIGPCNGLAALAKPRCTFDVTFVPTGSGFEDGVTIINTPEIDMSVPRRR